MDIDKFIEEYVGVLRQTRSTAQAREEAKAILERLLVEARVDELYELIDIGVENKLFINGRHGIRKVDLKDRIAQLKKESK